MVTGDTKNVCAHGVCMYTNVCMYFEILFASDTGGAEKSLARPWKETSQSDQDLKYSTKNYGVQTTGIYSCCFVHHTSLGVVL